MHKHSALSRQPGLLFPAAVKGSTVSERPVWPALQPPTPLLYSNRCWSAQPQRSARPAACAHRAPGARRQKAKALADLGVTVDCMGLVTPNDFQAFKHFYKWFQENHRSHHCLAGFGDGGGEVICLCSLCPANWTKTRRRRVG